MTFGVNQSGAIYGPTAGISRNMQIDIEPPVEAVLLGLGLNPYAQGGGNLNGSQNTAHLMGQAGTAGQRISVPRLPMNSGNFCGVV